MTLLCALAVGECVECAAELVAHDVCHVVFEHFDADVPRLVEPWAALPGLAQVV